jgi:hypothetical protein
MEFSYGEADSHSANQEIRPLNNNFLWATVHQSFNSLTARYTFYYNGNTMYKVPLSVLVKRRCTPAYWYR